MTGHYSLHYCDVIVCLCRCHAFALVYMTCILECFNSSSKHAVFPWKLLCTSATACFGLQRTRLGIQVSVALFGTQEVGSLSTVLIVGADPGLLKSESFPACHSGNMEAGVYWMPIKGLLRELQMLGNTPQTTAHVELEG